MAQWRNLLDQLDMDNHVAAADPHPIYQLASDAKWGIASRSVAVGETMTISAGRQQIAAGDFINSGAIINSGIRLVI
ncbi:MAG: hypothetical protein DDT20_01703 [Firmicutes bacterium]|nr:hypothetical protein [Bacillota bacterium]